MNTQEMKQKYAMLYDMMAASGKTENMKIFGSVLSDMMNWMIENKPDYAQEALERLCAIKWNNYLTHKEAEKIVSEMVPAAPWSYDIWKKAMESLGFTTEHEPYYNSCALWATMCMMYSDHAETLAMAMGVTAGEISPEVFYLLAKDLLKDKDGKFDIRAYFGL